MNVTFRYIIPFIALMAISLILTGKSISLIGTLSLFLVVPVAIVYMTAVFAKQLNQRNRSDNKVERNLIIVISLISTMAMLLMLFSSVFQLESKWVYQFIAFISVALAVGSSLYFFIKNFRKFDFYVAYEFLIVLTPSLILIGVVSLSSRVPKELFTGISNNIQACENNNLYLQNNFEIDSAVLSCVDILTEIKIQLIEESGGYHENSELVSGTSRGHFYNVMYRRKAFEKLEKALAGANLSQEDIEWLNHERISETSVADAVIKIELLKNRVLIKNVKVKQDLAK